MRRRDETHDPGIGAFSGRGRRLHFESFAGVHGAASQAIAGAMDSGQRFARQRGLVEGSRRRKESAVDGHDLACSHEDDVAMPDRIDGNILDRVILAPVRGAGSAIGEGFQVALRPGDGEILKDSAAGIHHGDHHCGKVGIEDKRGRHAEERHGIDTHPPRGKVACDGDAEGSDDGRGSSGPNPSGDDVKALKRRKKTRNKRGKRQ